MADEDIVSAIERRAHEDGSKFAIGVKAKTYAECLEFAVKNKTNIFILQASFPIAYIDDLLFDLQDAGLDPIYIIFERAAPGLLKYAVTVNTLPVVKEIDELFNTALKDSFTIEQINYNSTLLGDNSEVSAEAAGRHESLLEILRGCNNQEFSYEKEKYELDLRGNGYYLFIWELMGGGVFPDHNRNKFIYNFSGKLLLHECNDIIRRYDGGEAFYSTPTMLCIIINDSTLKSEFGKKARFEEMIQKLAYCTGNRTASRYLSDRIPNAEWFRDAYAKYNVDKSLSFFTRDMIIMRPALLIAKKQSHDAKMINALLQNTIELIRYDLTNSALDGNLRKLYFEILKPSMSYTLYYSNIAAIYNAIEEVEYSLNGAEPNISAPSLLQFSSIEEQFDILIGRIDDIRAQYSGGGRITSSVILKALNYITENYNRDISITDISGFLFISSAYLSQIFKRKVGCSVKKYLINYRIEQAKKMLRETGEFIYTISENVGFHEFRHFSRSFKTLTGLSPTEYRKQFGVKNENPARR